jgi:hypothetical protein
MDANNFGLMEMSLVFGPVLAIAVWELYSLDRDKRRRDKSSTTASGDSGAVSSAVERERSEN